MPVKFGHQTFSSMNLTHILREFMSGNTFLKIVIGRKEKNKIGKAYQIFGDYNI